MDQIEIRPPKTEAEWKKYDDFRWEILRKPLKTPNVPLKDNLEDVSFHLQQVDLLLTKSDTQPLVLTEEVA